MIQRGTFFEVEVALRDLYLRYTEAYARLYPDSGACSVSVADGYACFAGKSSPLSRATGLGLGGPIRDSDIRDAEDFLAKKGARPLIDASPIRDVTLTSILQDDGYEVDHLLNLYYLKLDCEEASPSSEAKYSVTAGISRQASGEGITVVQLDQFSLEDERAWVLTVGQGFAGSMDPEPPYADIYRTIFHARGTKAFLSLVDGVPVGGGALKISGNVAVLSTTSTIPAYRRIGVQSTLLQTRLDASREAGCSVAAIQATPGSDSERNIIRAGFSLAYSMTDLVKAL